MNTVGSGDRADRVTIGLIDPDTGVYSARVTFDVTNWQRALPSVDLGLSPDFTKFAVTMGVGKQLHAGWVDTTGKFTDVNLGETLDDFEGVEAFEAVGFDQSGDFFYIKQTNTNKDVYKVPAGATSGGQMIQSQSLLPAVPWRHGNGSIVFDGVDRAGVAVSGCLRDVGWLAPDTYLVVSRDHQIYKSNVANAEGIASCGDGKGIPLLPATNTTFVKDPKGSPDGTRVAFVRHLGGGASGDVGELYIVSADGSATPEKVNLRGVNLDANNVLLGRWI